MSLMSINDFFTHHFPEISPLQRNINSTGKAGREGKLEGMEWKGEGEKENLKVCWLCWDDTKAVSVIDEEKFCQINFISPDVTKRTREKKRSKTRSLPGAGSSCVISSTLTMVVNPFAVMSSEVMSERGKELGFSISFKRSRI